MVLDILLDFDFIHVGVEEPARVVPPSYVMEAAGDKAGLLVRDE